MAATKWGNYILYKWKEEMLTYVKGIADPDEIIFVTDGGVGCSGKTKFTRELEDNSDINTVTGCNGWEITSKLMIDYFTVTRTRSHKRKIEEVVKVRYPVEVICYDPDRAHKWDKDAFQHIIHWKLMHEKTHVIVFLPQGIQSLNGHDASFGTLKLKVWYIKKDLESRDAE